MLRHDVRGSMRHCDRSEHGCDVHDAARVLSPRPVLWAFSVVLINMLYTPEMFYPPHSPLLLPHELLDLRLLAQPRPSAD